MPNDIVIECADGFPLAATVHLPTAMKAAVMMAPATGIKRSFYDAFAAHLAKRGYGVITFDNRGVGGSQRGPLSRSGASLVDWGRFDMPAVLEHLKASFPGVAYHLVGHSAGGQLVGLMPNAHELHSMLNVGVSSGSLRNMRASYRAKATFFLNVFVPVSNALFGHTKSQWLGMGEPLPRTAAAQWSRWCNGSGYIAVDLGGSIPADSHHYDELTIPSLWLHATDDDIACDANVRDMIRVYSKLSAEIVALDPAQLGYRDIGHMKFFKREGLWSRAVDWLDAH